LAAVKRDLKRSVSKDVSREEEEAPKLRMKACWAECASVSGNHARQLLVPTEEVSIAGEAGSEQVVLRSGEVVRLVRDREPPRTGRALFIPPRAFLAHYKRFDEIEGCKWIGDRSISTPEQVLASLRGAFQFREDSPEALGLRIPQIGGLHAILGYWTTDPREPATVVMPTGTGKTETMLAVFAHSRLQRLLVLVPSDALREQLARKFETYGVLQPFGVISPSALRPIVGQLKHGISSPPSAENFARNCNIIIATPNAIRASSDDARDALLEQFSHLFVDEAHHLGAMTWKAIRDRFVDRRVVQFTATPFREDGRPLLGKIVYAFPIREAQRQGYFSRIDYISVSDSANPDHAIAAAAIAQLRADLAAGFDHLIMARVDRIGRAESVLRLYEELAPELHAVAIHSNAKKPDRDAALTAIRNRASRAIVCVDMLGEGFDLPHLKIAAMHDVHKSLGVTLQFVGRFARGTQGLGQAAIVVSRPSAPFDPRLHELYRQDADWNEVLRDLSQDAVANEVAVNDFERGFSPRADSITLQMLEPKMSTVVFTVGSKRWHLESVPLAFKDDQIFGEVSVNDRANVAWFLTRNLTPVRWGVAPELTQISYDLYVLYWDNERNLLYINSSNTDGLHEQLANKIFRDTAKKIDGEAIYRSMAGITRLVPTNVGVLDSRSHARRFSMHVGADVSVGFPVAEQVTKTQTNIFASGFERGERVTIGASLKGRIWSHRIARSLLHWVHWCDQIGPKLLNVSLSIDSILKSFIRAQALEQRPDLVFLAAEWPWPFYLGSMEETRLELAETSFPLLDVDVRVTTFETSGPVRFEIATPAWVAPYEVQFTPKGMTYVSLGPDVLFRTRRESTALSEVLADHGLTFLLEGDAMITHPSMLLRPNRELPPFDPARIVPLSWTGTNLRKESQGRSKEADSVQWRVIQHVLSDREWGIVLDDDGSGEIADIVALSASVLTAS
jgi:superfamily II DNA or RNA helicase